MGDFAAWQLLAFDDSGELAAVGHSVPFHWSGHPADLPDGWDAVLTQAVTDHDAGRARRPWPACRSPWPRPTAAGD